MIGTLDVRINAAKPNFPLSPLYAFVNSPSQVRLVNVPRSIGDWEITAVYVTVNYPDNSSPSVACTLTGGCWHATLPASTATGTSTNGFTISADGVKEDGSTAVTGYVLGKGDVFILATDGTITVGETTYYLHLLDAQPSTPKKGDLCLIGGVYKLYNGTAWIALGGGGGEPDAYLKSVTVENNTATFTKKDDTTETVTAAKLGAAAASDLAAHTGDSTIHVTASDKTAWNAKQDALSAGDGISILDAVSANHRWFYSGSAEGIVYTTVVPTYTGVTAYSNEACTSESVECARIVYSSRSSTYTAYDSDDNSLGEAVLCDGKTICVVGRQKALRDIESFELGSSHGTLAGSPYLIISKYGTLTIKSSGTAIGSERAVTFPSSSGTMALTSDIPSVVAPSSSATAAQAAQALATHTAIEEKLGKHGDTATRASGATNGVAYTLNGGADNDGGDAYAGATLTLGGGGEENGGPEDGYSGGAGATLTLKGGGISHSGQGFGGAGARLTLEGGGSSYGDYGSGGAGAELKIGGRGAGNSASANGSLTITHTGTGDETLTQRIARDTSGKRGTTDNACHATTSGFSPWFATLPTDHEWDAQPFFDTTANKWKWGSTTEDVEGNSSDPDATSVTFSYTVVEEVKTFTATRFAATESTSGENYVTKSYVASQFSSANTSLTGTIDNGAGAAISGTTITLETRKTSTVDWSSYTSTKTTLTVNFTAAPTGQMRYCELLITGVTANMIDLATQSGYTFKSADSTALKPEAGDNLIVFAEYATNAFIVSRQVLSTVTAA